MFGVSYQDIIKRINQETNISSEEIELKVKEKLSKMSDLVTKEGAAHIVAHELGVKIFQPVGKLTIDKLIAGMNSVNLLCKVVKLFGVREFKTEKRQGKVANLLVGDETGIIKLVMWDTNQIKLIEDSQIKENNGFKEFHLGNRSQITINPENETLNVKEVQLQQEFFKKQIKDLGDNDVNVSVFGTITQIFEPRFYEAHGSVQEKLVPILNFIFDDGTESIRTTAFRNQAEQIIEKSSKELYELRQFPEKLEEIKNKIIGKQINILVKVNKNEMFGRKELNVQRILDSNVIEEMQIS